LMKALQPPGYESMFERRWVTRGL
jgi:hypothetical protein